MKIISKILIIITIAVLVFFLVKTHIQKENTSLDIQKIRQQNDSLLNVISLNQKKVDSFSKSNSILFEKNESLNKKLVSTKLKAETYKKEHEKDVNYINNLSNNDVAKLFADQFK